MSGHCDEKRAKEIIKGAFDVYEGDIRILGSAIGALILGQSIGWRALRIVHAGATYRRYEGILGVRFKDVCPERGIHSNRSIGLSEADRIGSFWKVADGIERVPKKHILTGAKCRKF